VISPRVHLAGFGAQKHAELTQLAAEQGFSVVSALPADVVAVNVVEADNIEETLVQYVRHAGTLHTPVVAVGGPAEPEAYEAAAEVAQGYVPGDDSTELMAVVRMVLKTVREYAAVNPLTGLPGSPALAREIAARLPERGMLAVVQFDLDNFKPYNDVYGYRHGDEMIVWVSELIASAVEYHRPAHWFIAHLGGDDFFLTTTVAGAKAVADEVVSRFEAGKGHFFAEEHLATGCFQALSRSGSHESFALTTITAAMVTNEADDIAHPGHIAAVLAEVKMYGKRMSGSNFVWDRRQEHWASEQGN
jgi:GGDEF domain-containing protein